MKQTREIRFRAFDKLNGIMLPSFPVWKSDFIHFERLDDLILMEYSGLKDKNGKRIYEGDVCMITNSWNSFKRVCEFINSTFGFKGTNGTFIPNQEFMEVIGNIYENPELCN